MAKICLILAGLFALVALAWMAFLPLIVEHELAEASGFQVHVAVLAANPFTGRVAVRGLLVKNPPAYPYPDFVDLRSMDAEVEVFSSLFSGQLVLDSLYLDITKLEIVRQRGGKSNVGEVSGPPSATPSKPIKYLVKDLHIKLARLVIADASASNPYEKTYNLNLDQHFKDVSDPKQLLIPQVVRSLVSFGIRRDTAQILPGDFGKALGNAVGGAADALRDGAAKTGQFFKGLIDKLEQSAKP
jgi:uncharacterized protein involved in outer membrane biogenesis